MSNRVRSKSLCLQNTLKVENQRIAKRASSFRSCLKKNTQGEQVGEKKETVREPRRKSSFRCVMFSDEIGDNLVTSVFSYDEAEPAVINIEDLDNIDDCDFPDDLELPDPFDDWNPPIIDKPEENNEPLEPPEVLEKTRKFERVAEIQELDPENEFVIPLDDSDENVVNERLQIVFVKSDSDEDLVNVKVSKSCGAANADIILAKMSGLRSDEALAVHRNPIKSLAGLLQNAEHGDLTQSDRSADHVARNARNDCNDCNDANGNIISNQIPQTYISSTDFTSEETDIGCPPSPPFITPSVKISSYKEEQSQASVNKSLPLKILSVHTSSHEVLSVQKPSPNKILSVQKPTHSGLKLSPDNSGYRLTNGDKETEQEKETKEKSVKAQDEVPGCEERGNKKVVENPKETISETSIGRVAEIAKEIVAETPKEKSVETYNEKAMEAPREKVVCARRVLAPSRRKSAPSFQLAPLPPPPPNFAPPPLPSTPEVVASRRISLPS